MLTLLLFLWFIGIKIDFSIDEAKKYLSEDNSPLVVVFYDNSKNYCWIQSVDKFGMQRTMLAEYCTYPISSLENDEYIDCLGNISECTINLVKPWYYLKMRYYIKHSETELSHDYCYTADSDNMFTGCFRYNEITSEKILYSKMEDYRDAILWKTIISDSGISKYIKKRDLSPALFPDLFNQTDKYWYEYYHSKERIKEL